MIVTLVKEKNLKSWNNTEKLKSSQCVTHLTHPKIGNPTQYADLIFQGGCNPIQY